jgi:hypothetical protein
VGSKRFSQTIWGRSVSAMKLGRIRPVADFGGQNVLNDLNFLNSSEIRPRSTAA